MRRSDERILTTHAGSLARPDALRALLTAKDEGQPYDAAALASQTRAAVAAVVREQVAVGLDVVNDGEQSKRNFTTYARERLAGIEERVLKPGERVLA
jgi:5-methyltetrahydropteroyltriglutamate--homocysteine methyltransferase